MSLITTYEALNDISNHPGRLDKERLVQHYLNEIGYSFKKTLQLALDPYCQFHTKRLWDGELDDINHTCDDMKGFDYLYYLNEKGSCTDEDRKELTRRFGYHPHDREVVLRILNKDLRCGVSVKTAKKFLPGIKEHGAMLCIDDIEKTLKASGWSGQGPMDNLYWSVKLDGVRCNAVVNPGYVRYLSRNGKEFVNFHIFSNPLTVLGKEIIFLLKDDVREVKFPIIFDGEVIGKDKDFQAQMQHVRRLKDADPSIFKFSIFDVILEGYSLEERLNILKTAWKVIYGDANPDNMEILPHYDIPYDPNFTDQRGMLETILDQQTKYGEEGTIVKVKNSLYEKKRSNSWCKMKKFYTVDLPVIDWKFGTGRNKKVLGKFVCDFNGVKVECGSGLTDKQRKEFMTDTPKMIEVKYQEITKDGSLRFPTFVCVREDK